MRSQSQESAEVHPLLCTESHIFRVRGARAAELAGVGELSGNLDALLLSIPQDSNDAPTGAGRCQPVPGASLFLLARRRTWRPMVRTRRRVHSTWK